MMAGPELPDPDTSQLLAETQEMPLKVFSPEGTVCVVQVDPPSVVPMIPGPELPDPIASQLLAEGQEMPLRALSPEGTA